jgi:PAS domain S-box-containing protein
MHDSIFAASLAGMYVVDLVEKRHLTINRAYTEITGYALDDLAAMAPDGFIGLFHEDDRPRLLRHLEDLAIAELGRALDLVYRFRAADGRWLHCLSRHVPVKRDATGLRELVGSVVETGHRPGTTIAAEPTDRETAAQLDALFSAAPVGLGFWDTDLRFKRLNSKLAEINGLPIERHLGRRPDELLPNIHKLDVIMDRWREILSSGIPWFDVEITGTTHAGSAPRVWREHFFPVTVDGSVIGLGAVVEDVTERRGAERALLDSEKSLRAFIAHSPVMTGVVELAEDDSDVLHVVDSAATERFFGVGAGGTAGRWARRDLGAPEETVRLWTRMYRQAHRGQQPVRFSHTVSAAGARQTLDTFVAYIGPGESGRAKFCYSAFDDTERTGIEEALRASDRHKSDFLAILGHELRNPLAPLQAGLKVLRRSAADASLGDVVEMMQRQVQLLVRLVDDLLDIARIGRGEIALALRLLDLRDALRAALEQTAPQVAARGHSLDIRLPSETLHVHGDLGRLTQVFANLLSNACRYTEPGGAIAVALQKDGEHAVAEIRDTGRGIAAENFDVIFQLFSRIAGPGDADDTRGFGVGLALVRRLVALHGGSVRAKSAGLGHGSEFTVSIPLAPTPS